MMNYTKAYCIKKESKIIIFSVYYSHYISDVPLYI